MSTKYSTVKRLLLWKVNEECSSCVHSSSYPAVSYFFSFAFYTLFIYFFSLFSLEVINDPGKFYSRLANTLKI